MLDSVGLAKLLCEEVGHEYAGDTLSDVVAGFLGIRGEEALHRILRQRFERVTPSPELEAITRVPWRRIYTFNIDDSFERTSVDRRAQRYEFFNAQTDRRRPNDEPATCQVVHLNGLVSNLKAGVIFSSEEFTAAIQNTPSWYAQAGDDYVEYLPIFIGTKLDEPILRKEIFRSSQGIRSVGRAYLVVPEALSGMKQEAFKKANIEHVQLTLEGFAEALANEFPGGARPMRANSAVQELNATSSLATLDNINIAAQLLVIDRRNLEQYRRRFAEQEPRSSQNFYRGFSPSWGLVASGTAIALRSHQQVASWLAMPTDRPIRIVLGDAGCGKSTAVMSALAELAQSHSPPYIYEYVENGRGLRSALGLASTLHEGGRAIVYIDDVFLYAEELSRIVQDRVAPNITIVGGSRSSEWNGMVGRHIAAYSDTHRVASFEKDDAPKIIAAIENYVAAPGFNKRPHGEKMEIVSGSKRQLLILLKEITGERPFDEIIEDEFNRLDTDQLKFFVILVGFATLARVGMTREMARRICEERRLGDLEQILRSLIGIVAERADQRLFARHEVYVRHILQDAADFELVISALEAIITYFASGMLPIAKNFVRKDHQLFRYCLNAENLLKLLRGRGKRISQLFENFRVPFQKDGHYWLQYGLFLRHSNKQEEALVAIQNSVRAYPENIFARHALAHQQLLIARYRKKYDARAEKLVSEAVTELLSQHARDTEVDAYPLETLANNHCAVLVRHGRIQEARDVANKYHPMVVELERNSPGNFRKLKARLVMLASTGQWDF